MAKTYNNPAMHTAEHILNQTMVRMFNTGRAFSAHIETKKSKCDYKFNRLLTEIEILSLESKVNEIISLGLPVFEEFIDHETAERLYNLERLPEDAGNSIRVIKVGDYDSCPCSGSHVVNTCEIGRFKIVSVGFENCVLRVRYKLIDSE